MLMLHIMHTSIFINREEEFSLYKFYYFFMFKFVFKLAALKRALIISGNTASIQMSEGVTNGVDLSEGSLRRVL